MKRVKITGSGSFDVTGEMEEHDDVTAREAKHRGTTLVGGRCYRIIKISMEQKEYRKYKNKQTTNNKQQKDTLNFME